MADNFEITGQSQSQDVDAGGQLVDVMTITFKTKPTGVVGTQNVLLADYTPDAVAAVIGARATTIETVEAL